MKVISFSLWGNDPRLYYGALRNYELAKEYYPDWSCRFHICNRTEFRLVDMLLPLECEIEMVDGEAGWNGLFWRFFPGFDENVERFIVRDIDSRINSREAAAVKEWVDSGTGFHCMRDHPHHDVPIMGGMWGSLSMEKLGFKELLFSWLEGRAIKKGDDQTFLAERIWPVVKEFAMVHDSNAGRAYHHGGIVRNFPSHEPMKDGTFVGQILEM